MKTKFKKQNIFAKCDGYVTLISVLIVGAVGTSIVLSLLLLGSASSRTTFTYEQSLQAKNLADACAEDALEQIRTSTAFTGSGNLTIGQGSCTYLVTSGGGENRTITASGTVGSVIRKVTISITDIDPSIVVNSWQENA